MSSEDGLNLGAREAYELLRKARNGELSGNEIDTLWNQISDAQKQQMLTLLFDEKVVPHLQDIRARRQRQDAMAVRERYADLELETKKELIVEAVGEIVATFYELRENPQAGLLNLKELIRDPTIAEALLLVFDDPEYVDPAYSADAKEYAAHKMTAIGVALFPELYEAETVRMIYGDFGLETGEDGAAVTGD